MDGRPRYIAHLDLDCFFVSVERIHDPALRGKPVAVGGSPKGRGVVASASYEARAFGVRSAMPTGRALNLCPSLIVVRGRHAEYGRLSDRLYERLRQIAPFAERASIDEMNLDFTGCEGLYADLPAYMRTLQSIVHKDFSLPCTVALGSNKLIAKIAANTVKPNGVIHIPHGMEAAFLAPMPIDVIPGIGAKTAETMRARGFQTVADIQRVPNEDIARLLGRHGNWIWHAARGLGSDTVSEERDRKSISREETFSENIHERPRLESILFALVEDVCQTLRRNEWKARTVTLKLRYADFKTITRAETVEPTHDDATVFRVAQTLLAQGYTRRMAVRLIGVGLTHFVDGGQAELPLFPADRAREQAIEAVNAIRRKHGKNAIHVGGI